ncbi:hypothetical protein [Aurantiacibacter sp. D1-12]|uniref:hypothetical protein n=1 Tax=Aurantiacibacter sp. D1-12 TaxID=2993658 RepID=UPI00237CBB69|nr:hypothetical protein [Aurantiacibacter sp. D1-12]MDE1467256.1 hypothetical protein [Aurantiacibacter sp. D1-12]
MKKPALLLAACALTAGCAAPAYVSPVQVTRFVSETPAVLGQGTVQIMAAPGLDADSLEFAVYADAVRQELQALGYSVVDEGGAQTAMIAIESGVLAAESRRGPVSVGAGGSTGRYGSGVGVGVGINLGSLSGPPPERIEREIFVALQSNELTTNLWEGRATMVATTNSDYAADAAAAARMADALFAGFPGNSGETIEIE